MVYVHHIEKGIEYLLPLPPCARLDLSESYNASYTQNIFPLLLNECYRNMIVGYVCERPVKLEKHTQPQMPASVPKEHFRADLHMTCPSGHMTHIFLTCDLQSTCWGRQASSGIICEAPVRPKPPLFPCSDQFERIPYPLVCDHRPDCRDYSDENFCVFPECSAASFQCGNKQVVMIIMIMMHVIIILIVVVITIIVITVIGIINTDKVL